MFCVKCGAYLADDAMFCEICGHPVDRSGLSEGTVDVGEQTVILADLITDQNKTEILPEVQVLRDKTQDDMHLHNEFIPDPEDIGGFRKTKQEFVQKKSRMPVLLCLVCSVVVCIILWFLVFYR